jgi:enoyl-CoA hydratase
MRRKNRHPNIVVEQPAEGVALVRIDRPKKRNALDLATMSALLDTLDRLDADEAVRCIVVTGDDEAFSAGVDLKEMARSSPVDVYLAGESIRGERLAQLRTPVIAAVAGWCLGGGCELAMACDIILAASNTTFGFPEAEMGILPGAGGTQRFTRAVGKSRAMEHLLTGRFFGADEAERWGLVSRVVEPEVLHKEAVALAGEIAARAPLAVRLAKDAVVRADDTTLDMGMAYERKNFLLALATEDRSQAMKALRKKRGPDFKGR